VDDSAPPDRRLRRRRLLVAAAIPTKIASIKSPRPALADPGVYEFSCTHYENDGVEASSQASQSVARMIDAAFVLNPNPATRHQNDKRQLRQECVAKSTAVQYLQSISLLSRDTISSDQDL
jgi:hypothetical protein